MSVAELAPTPSARSLAFVRTCRECGCTPKHPCRRADDAQCIWADADLCSHCLPTVELRNALKAKRGWRTAFLCAVTLWGLLVTLSFVDALLRWIASQPHG